MSFHVTTEGPLTAITPQNGEQENAGQRVVTSRNEWETIAGNWPLKRLVAIWYSLSGVTPVEKFTSRQIALERIWRAVECPEQARRKATTKASKPKVPLPGPLVRGVILLANDPHFYPQEWPLRAMELADL